MGGANAEQGADFGARMAGILNAGAVATAMSLGYRAGLFDAMDRLGEPAGCERIAGEAGLDGRYVREWLAVMVCGGIVELSSAPDGGDRFLLPPGHADLLATRSGSANLGVYTLELPILVQCALEDVLLGMRTGQGVPYSRYPRFQEWMCQVAEAKHRGMLVDVFLPSVDQGRMAQRLRQGARVLDVGCSRGVAVLLLAAAFPRSRFLGVDISGEAVAAARAEARRLGLDNARFEARDAALLGEDAALAGSFHYVTAFDAVHDQNRPLDVLKAVRAVLAPEGVFSMVDIRAQTPLAGNTGHPMGAFLYAVSLLHCMPVGLVDGGPGLGAMWGRQKALEYLAEAGFGHVLLREIPTDQFNDHYECRVNAPG